MKPVNEKEFKAFEASIISTLSGVVGREGAFLAALSRVFRQRYDTDQVPARLRRDAGIDELDIERNRLAKAPLIR